MARVWIGLLLLSLSTPVLAQTTHWVNLDGSADFTDIQSALDAAADGDTVLVAPGEYEVSEPIDFYRLLPPEETADSSIVLVSEAGPELTVIRAAPLADDAEPTSLLVFNRRGEASSVVEGFTFDGGRHGRRGSSAPPLVSVRFLSPTLRDCRVVGGSGDGIHIRLSSPALSDCDILDHAGNGVVVEGASPTLTDCLIAGNRWDGLLCRAFDCPSDPVPPFDQCLGPISLRPIWCDCFEEEPFRDPADCCNDFFAPDWCFPQSNPVSSFANLAGCTIADNGRCGFRVRTCCGSPTRGRDVPPGEGDWDCWGGHVTLVDSIVWENRSPPDAPGDLLQAAYSCIEGAEVWPGDGNINADPRFCGWGDIDEIWVDATQEEPGDGSEGAPFRTLRAALEYRRSLLSDSPCIGGGENGGDMGAPRGVCEPPRSESRTVHIAPGRYEIAELRVGPGARLEGPGREAATLVGYLLLDEGSRLSGVTLEGGARLEEGATLADATVLAAEYGVVVSSGATLIDSTVRGSTEAGVGAGSGARIERCTVTENATGIRCGEGTEIVDCTVTRNSENGIYCVGSARVTDCVISDNTGVGIRCDANATVTGCTIAHNSGLGVYCLASATIENCAIYGNDHGVGCYSNSAPVLESVTVAGNARHGIHCFDASPLVHDSIVWGNGEDALGVPRPESSRPVVTFSCIEGDEVWPGEGNINADPLFCGWGDTAEVWVDSTSEEPGDGSEEAPFEHLRPALDYSVALTVGSPCSAAAENGGPMGAPGDTCADPATTQRRIHLAAGEYDVGTLSLGMGAVHLVGAGEGRTVVTGRIAGLSTGCVISDMTLQSGLSVRGGRSVVVRRVTFGAEIWCTDAGTSLDMEDCTVQGSRSSWGVSCRGAASMALTRCVVTGGGQGGVLCYWTSVTLRDSIIAGNGNGVECRASTVELTGCVLEDNGTGLHCELNSSARLVDCTVRRNVSGLSSYSSRLDVDRTTVLENRIKGVHTIGGSLLMTHSRITGNSLGRTASAGLSSSGSEVTLVNCLIAGQKRAGLSVWRASQLALVNCTVAANRFQGIVFDSGSSVSIRNCIVRGNLRGSISVPGDATPPEVSFSSIEGEELWAGEGNQNADPLFVRAGGWDLGATSGEDDWDSDWDEVRDDTWIPGDYHLKPNSPAIGAGTREGAPERDLDGRERICPDVVDQGAYESGLCVPSPTLLRRGDANADGAFDISDPVAGLRFLFLGAVPLACEDAGDANDDGVLDISDAITSLRRLFLGGDELPAPGADLCGPDPSDDALSCPSFAPCE